MGSTRRKPGELSPQVEGYHAWLAHQRYTPQTVRNIPTNASRLKWIEAEFTALRLLRTQRN